MNDMVEKVPSLTVNKEATLRAVEAINKKLVPEGFEHESTQNSLPIGGRGDDALIKRALSEFRKRLTK